jgi:O-antigen/teichoic acid export membrane protein
MGYTKTAITGVSWMGLLRGAVRGGAFIRTIVLARILTPDQFGIFAIATLTLGFLEMATETGINIFLIQEDDSTLKKLLNTAWSVSIVRGLIISVIIFFSANILATFFDSPHSVSILKLTALIPLIRGLINPAIIKFQKNLQFSKEFLLRTAIFAADTIVAISIALIFKTPSSLGE